MKYFLFIDESGDHGLSKVDPAFPIFTLCGIIFTQESYEAFRLALNELKLKYWEDTNTILHSRDIRKCEGPFKILFNQQVKESFYLDFNEIVEKHAFIILTSSIDKIAYTKKYGYLSDDVYEISLSFLMERAIYVIEKNQERASELQIILERRGNKEDKKLEEHFQKLMSRGTFYVSKNRFAKYNTHISFNYKKDNINGLQLADLVAYPIARFILDPVKHNPAFEILKSKIYSKGNKMYGLKKHP
ncbi:DUF3800 domain-containing protein [Adhaeribacter rhizoryzae]|uniref:DUF3800 domain-containing protein n=1 Tax=Adhaeribacter rhizoryzae TaxID=2607907 RepID=A0A5M6CWR3_9BACT|nr:DUF3800 domain-containing protein [Adhaeribacter rhizoryzae]KAA5539661.1 DUF3800 domain-containing protein [Adhaeribacter rhizoryzae]